MPIQSNKNKCFSVRKRTDVCLKWLHSVALIFVQVK